MPFYLLSNVNGQFIEIERLIQKNHITAIVLFTIKKIELINKKKFIAATLDKKTKIFIVHVTALLATSMHLNTEA